MLALELEAMVERDRRPNRAAPIVAYGSNAILRFPHHVAQLGAKRLLLVTGKRSFEESGAAWIVPALERCAKVHRWSEFAPNTDSADLIVGLEQMRSFQPDMVVGIGGGSALDMAKLLVAFEGVPPVEVLGQIRAGFKAGKRRPHLALVPTTSGSGAEATHFAVVYVGDQKHSIGGEGMRPDAIVLDPTLTLSGSAYQRATSGIDAISQAIESLWASGATPRSRHFARAAVRVLVPSIETFVNQPDDESARAMAIGSHLAGRAIDISRTTAAHALSYGITKGYGISHGHAVALTLGGFIELNANAQPEDLAPNVDATNHSVAISHIMNALDASSGIEAHQRFDQLLVQLGLNPSLTGAGIRDENARRALTSTVNVERLSNNPVQLAANDLNDLLKSL